ncbi:MAG: hypothetical protein Q9222_001770 [Ikaeria aurantiellina]
MGADGSPPHIDLLIDEARRHFKTGIPPFARATHNRGKQCLKMYASLPDSAGHCPVQFNTPFTILKKKVYDEHSWYWVMVRNGHERIVKALGRCGGKVRIQKSGYREWHGVVQGFGDDVVAFPRVRPAEEVSSRQPFSEASLASAVEMEFRSPDDPLRDLRQNTTGSLTPSLVSNPLTSQNHLRRRWSELSSSASENEPLVNKYRRASQSTRPLEPSFVELPQVTNVEAKVQQAFARPSAPKIAGNKIRGLAMPKTREVSGKPNAQVPRAVPAGNEVPSNGGKKPIGLFKKIRQELSEARAYEKARAATQKRAVSVIDLTAENDIPDMKEELADLTIEIRKAAQGYANVEVFKMMYWKELRRIEELEEALK